MADPKGNQRLEFLGQLAGGLAHEIKNPLSTLNINLQLLRESWKNAKEPREVRTLKKVEILLKEVRRLEEIVNDFLRYARGGDLTLAPADVNAVVEEVVAFIAPRAVNARISLLKSTAPGLPAYRLDRDKFKQALLNLILNGIEAMPTGGELMIRTYPGENGAVVVEIIDTGEGIAPDRRAKIFRAYFSTKKGGTGLGLATTKRIIEEHDGTIEFHSEMGKGTSFKITLPIKAGVGLKPAPAS
ncbi:MAG: ATP-binding protein [Planctomycetota bacterium]